MTSTRPTRLFITIALAVLVSVAIIVAAGAAGITAPGLLGAGTAFWLIGATLVTLTIAVPLTLWSMDRNADATARADARIREDLADEILSARREARDDLADVAAEHDVRIQGVAEAMQRLHGRVHAVEETAEHAAAEGAAIAAKELQGSTSALRSDLTAGIRSANAENRQHWKQHEGRHAEEAQAIEALQEANEQLTATLADHAEETSRRISEHRAAIEERLESQEQALGQSIAAGQGQSPGALQDQLRAASKDARAAEEAVSSVMEEQRALRQRVGELENKDMAVLHEHDHELLARIDQLERRLAKSESDQRRHDAEDQIAAFEQEQFDAFRQEVRQMIRHAGIGRAVAVREENGITITADSPFGKVYPVAEVEGIGNKTAYALQRQGILDTEHLWHADTAALADDLGITARQVRQWQSQAELMAINGIGRQWSELLAVSGVASISQMASLRPRELLDMMEHGGHIRDRHVQKGRISTAMVEEWIHKAQEHAPEQAIHV